MELLVIMRAPAGYCLVAALGTFLNLVNIDRRRRHLCAQLHDKIVAQYLNSVLRGLIGVEHLDTKENVWSSSVDRLSNLRTERENV